MLVMREGQKAIERAEAVKYLERYLVGLSQVECPVYHHFGPGVYIREVHMAAGTLALGHSQRFAQLNIVLKGSVAMVTDSGELKVIKAPTIFTGGPGRKFGYVLEDVIWQNVYATSETDVDTLEATYLDKSMDWREYAEQEKRLRYAMHDADRRDFREMLGEFGLVAEDVRRQSENNEDVIPMPPEYNAKITLRESQIEGRGIFLSAPVCEGSLIGPARIGGKRTPLGRYTNHAKNPNAVFKASPDGGVYLVALRNIHGCIAGGQGEEVTVDYRQALALRGGVG